MKKSWRRRELAVNAKEKEKPVAKGEAKGRGFTRQEKQGEKEQEQKEERIRPTVALLENQTNYFVRVAFTEMGSRLFSPSIISTRRIVRG